MATSAGPKLPKLEDNVGLWDLINDKSYDLSDDPGVQVPSLTTDNKMTAFGPVGVNGDGSNNIRFMTPKSYTPIPGMPRFLYSSAHRLNFSYTHWIHTAFSNYINVTLDCTIMNWFRPSGERYGPSYNGANAVAHDSISKVGGVIVRRALHSHYTSQNVDRDDYEAGIVEIPGNEGDGTYDLKIINTASTLAPTNGFYRGVFGGNAWAKNSLYSNGQSTEAQAIDDDLITEDEWNCIIMTFSRETSAGYTQGGQINQGGTGYSSGSARTPKIYVNGVRVNPDEDPNNPTTKWYWECLSNFKIQGLGYPDDGTASLDGATSSSDYITYTAGGFPASSNPYFNDGNSFNHGKTTVYDRGGMSGGIGTFAVWDSKMNDDEVKQLYRLHKSKYRPND